MRADHSGNSGAAGRSSNTPEAKRYEDPVNGKRELAGLLGISVALLLLLGGCGDGGQDVLTKSEPGPISAEPQRPGDPEAGLDALLNRAVVTCGIPYEAYLANRSESGPRYELPGRSGRNAALPYGLTAHTSASGVELVTTNCLSCHAAPIEGELVIGLGNEFLDFTGDPVATAEAAGAFIRGEAAAAEWRKWANRLAAIAPYMVTDTVGSNPANNLTLALLAHRDARTLAWSDEPLLEPPPNKPLPVSVPPLWNLDKKHALFYNGEGRGDHARFMMLASTVCTDTLEEATRIDTWITDVRAYLAALEPPSYPYAIDQALASEGRELFNDNCKRCHGVYGDRPRYPNKVIALEKIETDPALAEGGYKDADRFVRWFNRSFYGQISRASPALGYIAPPLDGVWSTAPYLHNGSVPTLAALLDSAERPAFWRYGSSRPEYDPVAVGWSYETLEHGKAQAGRDERKWIYDTTLEGYGNGGHTGGDELNDEERRAVIEYLKTL